MECNDIPALARFEKYARTNRDCDVTQSTLARVRELIAPVPKPLGNLASPSDTMMINGLKQSCEAVEAATRIIWACAATTDQITPPIWLELPDFDEAIMYFRTLSDLDLMALTKEYRLAWEVSEKTAPDLAEESVKK